MDTLKQLEQIARIQARAFLRITRLAFPGMNAGIMARAILLEEEQSVRDDLSPIEGKEKIG
jgi:hypothetical protein